MFEIWYCKNVKIFVYFFLYFVDCDIELNVKCYCYRERRYETSLSKTYVDCQKILSFIKDH